MTRYKKTEKKPCENCNGTGRVRNRYGTSISCKGCRGTGRQKYTTIVEELPDGS